MLSFRHSQHRAFDNPLEKATGSAMGSVSHASATADGAVLTILHAWLHLFRGHSLSDALADRFVHYPESLVGIRI